GREFTEAVAKPRSALSAVHAMIQHEIFPDPSTVRDYNPFLQEEWMAHRTVGFAAALIIAQAIFAFGQDPDLGNQFQGTRRPAQRPAAPARPTPHYPDGRVNFGPPPGEAGLWLPGSGGTPGEPWPPRTMQVPFQPWAQQVLASARQT